LIETLPVTISSPGQTGLYTGIAGIGFVLEETYKAAKESKYRKGALTCVERIYKSTKQVNSGIDWNNVTDIISGSSGIGLFLLYASEKMEHSTSLDLAIKTGNHLTGLGIPEKNGLKWPMSPDYPRLMPNFSHGTAGVCYFLCSLYEKTDQKKFLETALKGAHYLLEVTNEQGFIFHHEPEGDDLCYLGWCHGPPGTARLYYKLWQITNDERWLQAIEKSAQGMINSGIPETQVPGFWNNVSQCCGTAGVADFFLNLYKITKKNDYLEFTQKLTENLILQATAEKNGLKWIQAEHRTRPDFLVAQTGFMQGAAGVGMWLLHFDAFEQNKKPRIKFPDSPF
jgi:lantibiotic modifying enzyme